MNALVVLLGILSGTAAAWALNKLLAGKIKEKKYRTGLQATSYIVCIVLGMAFAAACSLQAVLDAFLKNRIAHIEAALAGAFPNAHS
jgi:hypothetical protein